jgi:hypothetical protein
VTRRSLVELPSPVEQRGCSQRSEKPSEGGGCEQPRWGRRTAYGARWRAWENPLAGHPSEKNSWGRLESRRACFATWMAPIASGCLEIPDAPGDCDVLDLAPESTRRRVAARGRSHVYEDNSTSRSSSAATAATNQGDNNVTGARVSGADRGFCNLANPAVSLRCLLLRKLDVQLRRTRLSCPASKR